MSQQDCSQGQSGSLESDLEPSEGMVTRATPAFSETPFFPSSPLHPGKSAKGRIVIPSEANVHIAMVSFVLLQEPQLLLPLLIGV